ncbi:MAG TPA: PH domain-containing protein [Nitrososphaeraceae archaeon]|nr:PH domain-containing protein [Nitrososphaeraceae archaeon]
MDKNQGTFVTDITNKDELNEIEKIKNMLNPNEKVLLVARQSRFLPGGSALTPNVVIATDRRIIIRDPYDLGFRSEIVDIPYDVITSVKLMKGVLTSTILFKAPALVNKSKLGLLDEDIAGEDDQDGAIQALPKGDAEDLLEIIRRGIQGYNKTNEPMVQVASMSIADEINKLSKLRDQGIITATEFEEMKNRLIKNL